MVLQKKILVWFLWLLDILWIFYFYFLLLIWQWFSIYFDDVVLTYTISFTL